MKANLGSSTLKNEMKNRYWLIKRSGTYYAHDSQTRQRESLRTKSKAEAQRLIAAKNETLQNTALNLQLGKVYLAGHDPKLTTRSWFEVMDQMATRGKEKSQRRCRQEMNSKPFDLIRDKKVVETTAMTFAPFSRQERPPSAIKAALCIRRTLERAKPCVPLWRECAAPLIL